MRTLYDVAGTVTSMTSALTQVRAAAEEGGHEVVNELLFEPIWFGVIALGAFAALLLLLMAFRNTLALDPHGPAAHSTSDVHGTRAH